MALHPKFPKSPYDVLEPEYRWFPADEALRTQGYEKLLPPLVAELRKAVKKWRDEGLQVYFTNNTGQDVHLICQKKDAKKVSELALQINDVKKTIINTPAKGASLTEEHLF